MASPVPFSLLELLSQQPSARRTETFGAHDHLVFLRKAPAPADLAAEATALLEQAGLPQGTAPTQLYRQLGGFLVKLSDAEATRLRGLEAVATVEADAAMPAPVPLPDPVASPQALPAVLVGYANATASSGEIVPWGVRAVWQGQDISSRGNVGAGTWAFVIDSGILTTTGDLNVNTAWSRSWVAGESPFTDGVGHGTHVAGTIGALANGIGVVGVAPGAEVVSLKVFDSLGNGASNSAIIAAIDYAVSVITTNNLDRSKVVINMSLGGGFSSALDTAVRNAANQGIRFSIAAGNGNSSGVGVDADTVSPASAGDHPNVYTVSAVDSAYRMAAFSNWDRIDASDSVDDVDMAAPGVGVLSYAANGQLASWSGTSMAAPHVAGLLLLGGVSAGDLVTANAAGAPDPFAWGTSFPPVPGTPTPGTPVPTYALSGPVAADEGTDLSLSVSTTNLAAGTSLYWRFSGTGITTADFTGLAGLSGSTTLLADGTAAISAAVAADALSEGSETLTVELFSDAALTTPVAGASVILNDTSRTPVPPSSGDLVLWGTSASDSLSGGVGNDRLTGVLATGTRAAAMGKAQIDTLTGGDGADVFVLGDGRGMFYDDRTANNLGNADYALITDFQAGSDKLQLVSGSYITTTSAGLTSLYRDNNGDGLLTSGGRQRDELIAVINAPVSSADVLWV